MIVFLGSNSPDSVTGKTCSLRGSRDISLAIIRETKCKEFFEDGISKNKHKNRGLKLVKIILGKRREVRGYSSIDLSKD